MKQKILVVEITNFIFFIGLDYNLTFEIKILEVENIFLFEISDNDLETFPMYLWFTEGLW